MTQRQHKGAVILGYLSFIKHQWGQDGLGECLASTELDIEEIQPESLYPIETGQAVLEWISKAKGMDYVRMAGNHTVKNLGSLAYLVRFVNIKHLLKRAKDNYKETFSYGAVSVMEDDYGKRALVIMKNANFYEESNMAWLGAFEGIMEVTRTKGTVKQNKCQMMGDEYDEFLLDWS
jgi:flagellar basal body rod protein FlgG